MSDQNDSPLVTYALEGGVATVTLDDGKANALGHTMLDQIGAALDRVEADGASAVVIAGRDGKFSAGFDLAVMTSGIENAAALLGRGAELGLRLYQFPRPVVFAVTGHALAMGGILMACADIRIGAEGPFKIGLPEVRIGMPVPGFAVELCRDRLSPQWFTRAVQLAHSFSPAEALEAGFLDEVVDADQVRDRAHEIAVDLAENLHAGPFATTRTIMRTELADKLRGLLAQDVGSFTVEMP